MWAAFLIPKSRLEANGHGEAVALGLAQAATLQLTLAIEKTIEQQSIEVHLEGSVDGETWLEKPIFALPQKFYEGVSVVVCDLGAQPQIGFVRASWRVNRWGRGVLKPDFEVYLFAESVASVALDSN